MALSQRAIQLGITLILQDHLTTSILGFLRGENGTKKCYDLNNVQIIGIAA